LTPSAPVPDATTSGKAIASLVCGILNFFPFFVIAIVLGHISLSEIRKSAGRLKGEGLAIAGLVLGYLGIVAIPLILIVAAIAIPNLLRAKIAANESSAMHSVRALGAAEVTYRIQHGDTGFTCKLSDLSSVGVADPSLMSGQKHGYVFAIQNCKADTSGAIVSFQVIATPLTYGSTGSRTFCADESGTIRSARSGSAEDCLNQGEYIQ
jgi:type II secretory pathway pseudopilin PulG